MSSQAQLEAVSADHFRVSGVLDASTAGEVLEESAPLFAQARDIEVDLGGVSEGDSAGLALLIEWLRIARQAGKPIRFKNVPAQIDALARISEVEELICGQEAATAAAKQ